MSFRIIFLLALACTSASQAQTGDASLHGQVLDSSGGAVTKAKVIVTRPDGRRVGTTKIRQGEFELKGLASGNYSVEVIAKGFAKYKNALFLQVLRVVGLATQEGVKDLVPAGLLACAIVRLEGHENRVYCRELSRIVHF